MFTDWKMGRKRKLRGSLFSLWMVHMLKWKQAQFLDWGDFRFWSSLKGKWLVCGVAYLHFMSITLLIWATVLFYSQFLGTFLFPFFLSCYLLVQFYLLNSRFSIRSVFASLDLSIYMLLIEFPECLLGSSCLVIYASVVNH